VILLIAMPFVVLILIILFFRMMRGLRNASEVASRQTWDAHDLYERRPSDDYHDQTWLPLCEEVADAACARLGRPLSEKERRVIWRSRTALVLEVALKEIPAAADAGAVAAMLRSLPAGVDRPDPTQWCMTGCLEGGR